MGFNKTTWNEGAAPGISAAELNRIEDGIAAASPPAGAVAMFAGSGAAPDGWLWADGSAVSRATYAALFAAIGTTYGAGDGSTTFNVPQMRGRFPLGKAASGVGSVLGETGGDITPTVNLAHTHTIGHGHADTFATATAGSHSHSLNNHTHSTDIDHDHGAVTSAGASAGSRNGSQATAGLYSQDDLDSVSDNTSHRHGDGSLAYLGGPVTGYTDYATASHYHLPAGNSVAHTHSVNLPNYNVANRVSSGPSNNSTDSEAAHSHSVTGSVTDHSGNSGSGGSSAQALPLPPYLALNFIIKT